MVTAVENRVEIRQITLEELGAELSIPIKVRPWWGSRIEPLSRIHKKCGEICMPYWARGRWWCPKCNMSMARDELELRQVFPRRRVCPAAPGYSSIKQPEIQRGVVILWAGPCQERWGNRRHKHRQELEVLDVGETAILLRINVSSNYSQFLIGVDDGHPFITSVLRRLTTVQDAFDWLVPNKVQEAMILGKDVKRQGDWFFLPTEAPKYWNHHKPFYTHETGYLYRNCALWYGDTTRHRASLVVYKTFLGLPYEAPVVQGNVRAPDHPTLHLDGWHIAIRTRSTTGGRGGPGLD